MTIETELQNLASQVSALDATIDTELIDVNNDIIDLRTRVVVLETVGTGGTGGSTGGGSTGGSTTTPSTINVVTQLPTTGTLGSVVIYNGKIHYWNGTAYQEAVATANVPQAVEVVTALPTSAADGTVVFNTTTGYMYRRVNGAWTQVVVQVTSAQEVADASLTVAKFAQGLRPVEIVSSLPTTGNVEGRLVFLTTDDKLYRFNGTNFVSSVATADLTGTIGADQIAANAITTGKIQAGAITASQIATDAVNATKIAAGSITSDKIVANAVTADKVATNAITADKIAANAITAGKIAAAAIGATEVAAGSLTADRFAAGTITAASGVIGSAAVGTLQIAGNAVTQAVSVTGAGDTSVGTSTTNVLSLSITTSGTQPILVNVSAFIAGAYNGVFNSATNTAVGTVSLAGQSKSVIPFLTTEAGRLICGAGSVMFTGVSAGTHTITLSFNATDTSSGAPGYAVRTPSMTVLETKR